MKESDTTNTDVHPDAFKEIKKFREGESMAPFKYFKKQTKEQKNTRNQNLAPTIEEENEEKAESSQPSVEKTEETSLMRCITELTVKLDEVKIALTSNKTQMEINETLIKGGARPKTGNKYSWAP